MAWIWRVYSRRVVNVNVNVVLAGVLSLIPTAAVAHAAEPYAPDLAKRIPLNPEAIVTGLSFLADGIADVIIYYILHWLANHAPRRPRSKLVQHAYEELSFIKDATLVQFERATLAPLLYGIALSLQYFLLHRDIPAIWATVIAYSAAIAVTRVLHTFWMIRQERRALARMELTRRQPAQAAFPVAPPAPAKPYEPAR